MTEFDAAWQEVRCVDCGERYRCTPSSDYYHRPDVLADERTLKNGVCEPCLLGYKGRRDSRLVMMRRAQG